MKEVILKPQRSCTIKHFFKEVKREIKTKSAEVDFKIFTVNGCYE